MWREHNAAEPVFERKDALMPRMEPLQREDVPELSELLTNMEQKLGFLSNDLMTMARKPDVLKAFMGLLGTINRPSPGLPAQLKSCINHIAAGTVGCQYCSAHTATFASNAGASNDKLLSIWEYERSPHFDDAERAALRFAQLAASVPNLVTDEDFAEIRGHYNDEQIVEILLVVCLSAFFTRWNLTMATELEDH